MTKGQYSVINNAMLLRFIIIAVITILPTIGQAQDNSITTNDILREIAWQAVHAIDYGQTLEIARQPNKYHELNPIMGKHPSVGTVNTYMIASAVLHPVISYLLPSKYRATWQYISIIVSSGCVINNYHIGLGVRY
uniref:Uncharacterized protein n=1 Tax=viral metagenome TaxID=1070528 RepID=A0A6M3L9F7_9ZZZZ